MRQLRPEDSSGPAGVTNVAAMPSPRRYTKSTREIPRSIDKVYSPGGNRVLFQYASAAEKSDKHQTEC